MFDAILFDLDGTLLDSLELIVVCYHHTLAAHGLPPRTDEDILAGVGATLSAQFVRWGYADQAEALAQTYIDYNLEVHDEHVRPFAGVDTIVHELAQRGIPLALVTSKRRRGGEKGLHALGLHELFPVAIYGDEVERPKPDPQPVELALAGLGLPASPRIAFVGDAIHDVDAGRAAGVHTIAVSWGAGKRVELEGADDLVDDAAGLRRLLLT